MLSFFKKISVQAMEDAAVRRAIGNVLDKRTYYGFTGHPHVKLLEEELSKRFGAPVLGINSGTDALILALKISGVREGDEVIVPAFSFISTVSAVAWLGAKPVFVDIKAEDYALDHLNIEPKITSKTKAIVLAHLFGQPAINTAEILDIARKHKLFLIEDAAQSFGAKIKINDEWKYAGTIGDIGCFSFSSTKPFAAPGSGGAIIFNSKPELREEADRIRFYGARHHYLDYPTVGINIKLHEIQAAALLARLKFFDYWLNHRQAIADVYYQNLSGVDGLSLPRIYPDTKRTWYRFTARTKRRDELFEHLSESANGISHLTPTKHYPAALPYFSAFQELGHKPGDFPVADAAVKEVISFPITNFISQKEAAKIAEATKDFFVS